MKATAFRASLEGPGVGVGEGAGNGDKNEGGYGGSVGEIVACGGKGELKVRAPGLAGRNVMLKAKAGKKSKVMINVFFPIFPHL
jgi:hypothetical protein